MNFDEKWHVIQGVGLAIFLVACFAADASGQFVTTTDKLVFFVEAVSVFTIGTLLALYCLDDDPESEMGGSE